MNCGRCKGLIAKDKQEYCWFCDAPLCYQCWEYKAAHCGHPEADAINEASRTATYEQRQDMAKALWGEENLLVPITKTEEN